MTTSELKFSVLLYGMLQMLRAKARSHPALARRIAQRDMTAQIKTVGWEHATDAGNGARTLEFDLRESFYLGTIALEKRLSVPA